VKAIVIGGNADAGSGPRSNGPSSPSRARAFIDAFREARWLNADRVRGYSRLMCVCYLAVFVAWLVLRPGGVMATLQPIGGDFPPYWSSASMALHGDPAGVYDRAKLSAAEKATLGDKAPGFQRFQYPPMFLAMILPLALLPYSGAMVVWTLVGVTAYLSMIRKVVPGRDTIWVALAFPAALLTILDGQNGLITTALFGGGLILLERRPWVAGALFGLLCYKPQFGLLLPLALLAERQWRAIAGAALVVVVFAGLSAALFGMETWRGFLAIVPVSTHEMLEKGDIGFGKIQSVFGAARLWGASIRASYVMQAAYSLPAACAVLWIWLKPVGFPVKAAALAAGTLLITPYFLDYDSVLLALPIAWLYWDAMHSDFLPWEKSILFLVWLFPMFARILGLAASLPLMPLVLALLMFDIVRRAAISPPAFTSRIAPVV